MQDNPVSFEFDGTHFAHVTLFQAFIEKDQLSELMTKLTARKWGRVELEVKDFDTSKIVGDESTHLLNLIFKKNSDISDLQQKIKREYSRYFNQEGSQQSFYLNEKVDQQFIDYVKNFEKDNFGDSYSPHLTMGIIKKLDKDELYFKQGEKYSFQEMAIVQLGNYGTARKILGSFHLR